jgi:dienelactone hydrolase
VWYPAQASSGPLAPYVDALDQLSKTLSRDEVALAKSTVTHARTDAPLLTGTQHFPIVLFSPGFGSLVALYTSICEELASHGFLVFAVDHAYDSRAVFLENGRVVAAAKEPPGGEPLLKYQRERVTVRAADLRFVINQLFSLETIDGEPLSRHLDLSRVGALGHSVGGMTATELCMRGPHAVDACGNLDGVVAAQPLYPDEAGRGPELPVLFVSKPFAAVKGEKPADTEKRTAMLQERGNATLRNVRHAHSYRITLPGATHATFSDEELLTTNTATQRVLLDRVRTFIVQFFDETLRDATPTIGRPTPASPRATIEIFSPR